MLNYRAYIVGLDGHVLKCVELDCATDSAALEQARGLVDDRDVEIWNGSRFVAKLDRKRVRV